MPFRARSSRASASPYWAATARAKRPSCGCCAGRWNPTRARSTHAANVKIAILPQDVPQDIAGSIRDVVALGLGTSGSRTGNGLARRAANRAHLGRDGIAGRGPFRESFVGHETTRAAGPGPGLVARLAAVGRADEPSRHRRDSLAGRVSWPTEHDADLRHARSHVPAPHGHANSGDRSRATVRLVVRLRHLLEPQGGLAGCRGKAERPLRQDDWPRKRSGFAKVSKPVAPATKDACERSEQMRRGSPRSTDRRRQSADGHRQMRSGAARWSPSSIASRSPTASGRSCVTFPRRIMRGDKIGIFGPNGAGKTTLLRLLLRTTRARLGQRALGHQFANCLLRSIAPAARTPRPRCRTTSATATTPSRLTASRGTSSAIWKSFCSAPSARGRRSASCPAASAIACCWPSCSPSRPMSSCWTSRRTISTPKRWNCSKNGSCNSAGPCSWSATIARS